MAKKIVFFIINTLVALIFSFLPAVVCAKGNQKEVVRACVPVFSSNMDAADRSHYARCLLWHDETGQGLCQGQYTPITLPHYKDKEAVMLEADSTSFYIDRPLSSILKGNVRVQQADRMISANTAYVYRNSKSGQVERIELVGDIEYREPDRLIWAQKANIHPQDKTGKIENVLYRLDLNRKNTSLPAWGRASLIQRFANQDLLLKKASYSQCPPKDKSWVIEAKKIEINYAEEEGVARDAVLRVNDIPVLYTPYISFPTTKKRKSGFLMPLIGHNNVTGFDVVTPYYMNIAPNYDATLYPHYYSSRGGMMGAQFRYLNPYGSGIVEGHFLPHDKAFATFIQNNVNTFPYLENMSTNRWFFGLNSATRFNRNLQANIKFQEVSDNYYLQDFNTNLATITERQLQRKADIVYTNDHWRVAALAQSYQTLNPINETVVSGIYERLPEVSAHGNYYDLPFNGAISIAGQYDQFHWPSFQQNVAQGPRFYFNPALSFPQMKPWGFITPAVQFVANYYDVKYDGTFNQSHYEYILPRYSIDGGLFFERDFSISGHPFTQTLEPRLFYLNVPYHDQTEIPVYDSGYLIFNFDQLFRTNRFSGFDRIGDTNQLSYAVTSRWLNQESGEEKASFSVGQIRYFTDRRVKLCQSVTGYCVDDPKAMGFLSNTAKNSPLVARAEYHFNPSWIATGDFVWNPATHATSNSHLNFHYQPYENHIINFGYTYLVNGDITKLYDTRRQTNNLHQATIAYAWPFNDRWSSLGAYSHNISKGYGMLSFLGVQYDSCCWAMRLMGGRSFKSLNRYARPEYNNNVYLQILLKGLGSVASSSPGSTINTYVPGYVDSFSH